MSYDFEKNELRFSAIVLAKLKKVVNRLASLKLVDSFGVDFHKTGYMPYVSSLVISRKKEDLVRLRRDGKVMTPLFHDEEAYNPGTFTLETSRSAANVLASWLSLNAFGQEGYQTLLGHSLEISEKMRTELKAAEKSGIVIVNPESYGCDIFLRCYKNDENPQKMHERELSDNLLLESNNRYLHGLAAHILSESSQRENQLSVSKSSAAFYNSNGTPVPAIRLYPLNPFITEDHAVEIVAKLLRIKKSFDQSS